MQILVASVWAEIYARVVKNMKTMKKTHHLALCAMICALSVAFMFLTGLIPIGTYALPCISGILLAIIVIESGYAASLSVYLCVSVLSFLLSADKEAALYYTAFFGIYPILKGLIERIKLPIIILIIKLLSFNVCVITAFFISIYILFVPKESFELFGIYIPWLFLIVGNGVFIVYDVVFTRLIASYVTKWRKLLKFK